MTKGKERGAEFFIVWSENLSQPFSTPDGTVYVARVAKHFPQRELTTEDYAYFLYTGDTQPLTCALSLPGVMTVLRHRMFPGDFPDDPSKWSQEEYDSRTNHGAF